MNAWLISIAATVGRRLVEWALAKQVKISREEVSKDEFFKANGPRIVDRGFANSTGDCFSPIGNVLSKPSDVGAPANRPGCGASGIDVLKRAVIVGAVTYLIVHYGRGG